MELKDRLRVEMTYKGIGVKELAQRAGISVNTLNMYLRPKSSIPAADIAVKLADVLGISVEYLVTGTEKKESAGKEKEAIFSEEKEYMTAYEGAFREIHPSYGSSSAAGSYYYDKTEELLALFSDLPERQKIRLLSIAKIFAKAVEDKTSSKKK